MFTKKCLILLILILITSHFSFSQDEGEEKSSSFFMGVSFSKREFFDADMMFVFDDFKCVALDIKSFYNYIGTGIGIWTYSKDAKYQIGKFSQTGISFDGLAYVPIHLGQGNIYLFGGAGGVYHFSTMSENFGSFCITESSGLGYDYIAGIQIDVASTIGGFIQYRGIDIVTDNLQVGSSGVEFGININLKIFNK